MVRRDYEAYLVTPRKIDYLSYLKQLWGEKEYEYLLKHIMVTYNGD